MRLRAWRQAVPVAAALGVVAALVGLAGLRRSTNVAWWLADRLPPPRATPHADRPFAEARARAIALIAERMPTRPRCLPRALLLAALLRRRGIAADLCLGTRITGAFDAHAWIEMGGVPVGESADLDTRYRCLWRRATLD